MRQFQVGETWRGPNGGLWRVTHVTSDGDAILRSLGGVRTLRRSSSLLPSAKWCQLQQGDGIQP